MNTLPVYLVIDVSASMGGTPLHDLNQALASAFADLRADPLAVDILQIAVIAFSTKAEVVTRLCPIAEATAPILTAGGATNYGAALGTLRLAIETDLARLRADGIRIYRPLAFFITDGQPTDSGWEDTLADLFALRAAPTILAVGTGSADPRHLQLLAGSQGTAFLAGSSEKVDMAIVIRGAVRSLNQSIISSGTAQGASPSVPAPPGWEPLTAPLG